MGQLSANALELGRERGALPLSLAAARRLALAAL